MMPRKYFFWMKLFILELKWLEYKMDLKVFLSFSLNTQTRLV